VTQTNSKGLPWLTDLRVWASFGIVVLHVSAIVIAFSPNRESLNWWVANVADSSVRWCVPAFVMISGALLLDPSRAESPWHFYRRRAVRILIPTAFWSAFYLILPALLGDPLGWRDVIHRLLIGMPQYHLWYLYMITVLYLFTPFLRVYVAAASRRNQWALIAILMTAAGCQVILETFGGYSSSRTVFTLFIPFLGYYLCGFQLRRTESVRFSVVSLAVAIIAAVSVTAIGTKALVARLGNLSAGLYLYEPLSPTVIAMSIAIFLLFREVGRDRAPRGSFWAGLSDQLSPLTLGIYVVHPFVILLLTKLGWGVGAWGSALEVPLLSAVVFGLSAAMVAVLIRVPILDRTVG